MKKSILILTIIAVSTAFFSSCEKDEGKLPNISFKSGGNYISQNDTVGAGDTVLMGIQASKAEDKDPLISFDGSRTYDGGAGSSFISESISNGDNFSKDIPVVMRNQAGKETYTFTVVNKDGLRNSVSLTLTVVP
jgi:hypothetical protein